MKTRYEMIKRKIANANNELYLLYKEKETKQNELEKYVRRHKSLKYDKLETGDVDKLRKIYAYFDKRYKIDFQGGLRCDNRGMKLHFWLDDDPDYIDFHLSSTCSNICFGGSTSWLAKAETFEQKIALISETKKQIEKILK